MLRIIFSLLVNIFIIPPFLQPGSSADEAVFPVFPDSTYLAVLGGFSDLGVPVSYESNPALYLELHQWLGTPHRRGGRPGIDCSGLVKIIFGKVYGMELQGSSQDIARRTEPIQGESLREGDLVFFRTRHQSRIDHVGIYLAGGKFIHTSSSQGVIVSDLNERYYKRTFVKAGRLLITPEKAPSMAEDQ